MAKQPQSIKEYTPAKGAKIAVTLKDGTEITGNVSAADEAAITLDDEEISRRRMQSITFRGRVVATRDMVSSSTGPGKKKRGRKKRLSRRTASGKAAAPRKKRGKKKAGTSRRGRRAATANENGAVAFALTGIGLMFSRSSDGVEETLQVALDTAARNRLEAFGIPTI